MVGRGALAEESRPNLGSERRFECGVGVGEDFRRHLEAFDTSKRSVLVFDVDPHLRVDLVERAQELRPELRVVAASEGDDSAAGAEVAQAVDALLGVRL